MANKHMKTKAIPLMVQKIEIDKTYGNIESCMVKSGTLICVLNICPSTESSIYKIQITYKLNKNPIAVMLSPELQLFDGKRPKHLYGNDSSGHPILCVFFPGYSEWNSTMHLVRSFIPWISTWLNAYEYWLITGEWHYPESPHGINKSQIKNSPSP